MFTNDYYIKRAFDSYYSRGKKNFMPLLLLSLVHRKYIGLRKFLEKGANTLFTTFLHSLNPMTNSFHLDGTEGAIEIYYDIPQSEMPKWSCIINFVLDDFNNDEDQQKDNIDVYQELIGHPYSKKDDNTLLFNFLCKIWDLIWNSDIPFDFNEIFNYVQRGILSLNISNIYPSHYVPLDETLEVLGIEAGMLHPKPKTTVCNPLGGSALLRHFYKNTFILGNTHLKALLNLAHLYQLTTNSPQGETSWNMFSDVKDEKKQYDYILLNPAIDGFNKKDVKFHQIENLLNEKYLDLLSQQGRMVCTIYQPDKYKSIYDKFIRKIIDNDWVEEIFNFHNQIIILAINKGKEMRNKIQLTYVDYHPSYSNGLFNWLKTNRSLITDINNKEIIKENYYLTSTVSSIKKKCIKNIPGFKMVRLGLLLTPLEARAYCDNPPEYSLNDHINGKFKKSYYPFNPYLTANDGRKETVSRNDFCLEEEALIVGHQCIERANGKFMQPFVFNPEKGNVCFSGSAFAIDTTKIDPRYLILEMNKNYFKTQVSLSKIFDFEIKDRADFDEIFLRLSVQVPDNETSLKRQEILVKQACEIHFQNMGKNLGIDFSSFYHSNDSALPPKTALKHCEYEIVGTLGRGGFGYTYLAKRIHQNDSILVAIKEFFVSQYQKRNKETNEVVSNYEKDFSQLALARKKFFNEALEIKKLANCKSIIKVFDVFDENNTSYYVMEYIKNGDLLKYTRLMKKGNGLEAATATRIIREVAEALRVMHQMQMNHLDVKPSNILIDNNGHAHLIDFGTVKDFGNGNQTTTVNVASQGFSAPEVSNGTLKTFSPQADIYSLGKTLEYMLQEDEPLQEKSGFITEAPISYIPPRLDELIKKCTAYDLADRPKDIDEFLTLLDECHLSN